MQMKVEWGDHVKWIAQVVDDPGRHAYIIEVEDEPAGHMRVDQMEEGIGVITVYLLEPWTGRGLGVQSIVMGANKVLDTTDIHRIYAFVRKDNLAGEKGFTRAGFAEGEIHPDCPENHFCLSIQKN